MKHSSKRHQAVTRTFGGTEYVFQFWTKDCHDGRGWYYWDPEYQDEGSCGSFDTLDEAISHAKLCEGTP